MWWVIVWVVVKFFGCECGSIEECVVVCFVGFFGS